jgi:hypothetical protein
MTIHPWWRGPLLGAMLGLPILGVGGRLVMRLLTVLTDAPAAASVEGTLTVLAAGTVSGIGGGLLYAVLTRLLPRHRWLRGALFAAALVLLTLRGLHPVRPVPLALFLPLALLYGVLLELAWHRASVRLRPAGAAA